MTNSTKAFYSVLKTCFFFSCIQLSVTYTRELTDALGESLVNKMRWNAKILSLQCCVTCIHVNANVVDKSINFLRDTRLVKLIFLNDIRVMQKLCIILVMWVKIRQLWILLLWALNDSKIYNKD